MKNNTGLSFLSIATVLSFVSVTGCLGTRAVVNDLSDGDAGTTNQGGTFMCQPGQWYSDPCNGQIQSQCAAMSQRAALFCPTTGRVANAANSCVCVAQNVGGSCQNGTTQSCPFTCSGGATIGGTQTCQNGVWGGCTQAVGAQCPGSGVTCTAGTTQMCTFTCANGTAVAGTMSCASNAWGACVQNAGTSCTPSTGACTNGVVENCGGCATGQNGQRTCSNGAWGACVCTGTTTACTAGTTQVCSLTCSGTQVPRQTCNASGNWDACACVGGTGGGTGDRPYSARAAVPTNFGNGFCSDSANLRVVLYDFRGCPVGRADSATAPVPGVTPAVACAMDNSAQRDRTYRYGDAKQGFFELQVYCGSAVYNGFPVGVTAAQAGFTALEVSRNGNPALANQLGNIAQARTVSANRLRFNAGPGDTIPFN